MKFFVFYFCEWAISCSYPYRILELRRQAIKLKREGKEDEMEQLFANALANDEGVIEMMGITKEQYIQALQEKYGSKYFLVFLSALNQSISLCD